MNNEVVALWAVVWVQFIVFGGVLLMRRECRKQVLLA